MLNKMPITLLRVTCWAMSALCKSEFKRCRIVLPYFKQLLTISDDDVISETLWGLVHITSKANGEELGQVSEKIPLNLILNFILNPKPTIKTPALKALGNLCAGPAEITENIMVHSCLEVIAYELRTTSNEKVARDLCWIVSNLALGTSSYIQKLLDEGIIKLICDILNSEAGYEVKVHAIYALCEATEESTEKQIWVMVRLGVIECLTRSFSISNLRPGVICTILKGLDNLMTAGQGGEGEVNQIAWRFDNLRGFDIVTKFTEYPNAKVSTRAQKLLDKFAYEQSHLSDIY